jgi:hypothetical protein
MSTETASERIAKAVCAHERGLSSRQYKWLRQPERPADVSRITGSIWVRPEERRKHHECHDAG